MRGAALKERGLTAAGRIAAKSGARIACDTFTARLQRGAGRVRLERIPYFAEQIVEFFQDTEQLILVGSQAAGFVLRLSRQAELGPAGERRA